MTPSPLGHPVLLDAVLHRDRKIQPLTDYSFTRQLHASYLTSVEFIEAARAVPIVFVDNSDAAANDGGTRVPAVTPVAMLGLQAGENLQLEGPQWTGGYMPAFVRRFPFLTGKVVGGDAPGVFFFENWPGFSGDTGEPLFTADGKPAPALQKAIDFLERFDAEEQRTRLFCTRLVEIDVLKPMKADVTLPNGESLSVDGFMTVDDDKLRALPDATVLELHRNGMLELLHAHLLSLGSVQQLIQRKAARLAAATH